MSKGLETLKEIGEETIKVNCLAGWVEETVKEAYGKRFDGIEKELKALEIIDKKNVNVGCLKRSESAGSYNYKMDESRDKCKSLTQDEFDLLKEVMK